MRGVQRLSNARRRAGSLACALTVSCFVACGGSAVVDGANGNRAGAGSVAGARSVAGASPAAGSGASSSDEACTASQDSGPCDAYVPSFWHNPSTGLCEPFVYGGCGGNANRYPSRDACILACPNSSDDWDACIADSNCTLISAKCCGGCEPVASDELVAINFAHSPMNMSSQQCPEQTCAPCAPVAENEQTWKYFKPVCRNARCTLIDVRESPLTECQQTSDCMLRDGAECCPQCDGSGWVPVNRTAEMCGGAPTACDNCTSPLPPDCDAVCLAGRCRLEGPL
ncbi:MAG TPA: BPTI/Kunitz domain-containing protein [Polyangiaceae bacterium]